MHACAEDAVDARERSFEIAGDAGNVLRVFGKRTWNQRAFSNSIDHAWRMTRWQVVVAQCCDCLCCFSARDKHVVSTFGSWIDLFGRLDSRSIECIGNEVCIAFVEPARHGNGATGDETTDDKSADNSEK